MKKSCLPGLVALLTLPLFAPQALAVKPLSSAELASHCVHYRSAPDGEDGIFCVRYIQGFINGAVATDERVAINVAAAEVWINLTRTPGRGLAHWKDLDERAAAAGAP